MTKLHAPLSLFRGPDWPNRLVLAPMTNRQSNEDGTLSENELRWLERRARGGFGLVMTCAAHVSINGQGWPNELGVWSDAHIPGLRRLADGLRAAGARSSIQLHHGGLRADATVVPDRVAPWDDSASGARALSETEIHGLVQDFIDAAVRAETAGFDGVEVHGAHGYLIAQFLDSDRNNRTDGYGSSLEGRSRFLNEILIGIRRSTGPDFQVGLRLSPERYGIRLSDAKALAQDVMTWGLIDYLDMSLWDVYKAPHSPSDDPRPLVVQFAELDRGKARLGVAGKIRTASDAQACLEVGADFVAVGTGGILHHDFAARAMNDPGFTAVNTPVSYDHLRNESVSDPFIEYLTEIRKDFVRSPEAD